VGAPSETPGHAAVFQQVSGWAVPISAALAGHYWNLVALCTDPAWGVDSALMNQAQQQTVLVTGASSQLGVFLIPRLLTAGFRVIALSRKAAAGVPESPPDLLWVHPHALGIGTKDIPLLQVDMLISCGPLEMAIEVLREHHRLERVVVFSTSSVFSKARSPDRRENDQIAAIVALESGLKSHCEQAGLPLLCLRPTLIYGCGLDRNISLLAALIRRHGWMPVAGSATGLRQPVHADDLAAAAVSALSTKEPLTLDSPACGGSTLSYYHMAELIFDSLNKPRRIIRLPAGAMASLAGLLAKLPALSGINREMIRRQNTDLVFDDSPLRQALNYNPRPFKPTPEDFEIPASARIYRHPD
jgi:nucleoside-diphosphate-sugar epimerase